MPATGRNEPCPCGSGKKFKKCCLGSQRAESVGNKATDLFGELRQAIGDMQFESLDELQDYADSFMQQRNEAPLDDFHGLSPEQMQRLLYSPFDSPEVVRFSEQLSSNPTAPIMTLFDMLVDAIGEKGLKPTAKGNLPRKFTREAAFAFWGKEDYEERTSIGGINREEDFFDLHVVRVTAELAGLIRKYKGKFILSRPCRASMATGGAAAIYPQLFRTYVEEFNWGYRDGFPELRFVQTSFLFTLYLLTRYGDTDRSHTFYEDCFLRAFPAVLNELPPDGFFPPEEDFRRCYTRRALVHFVGFFGLGEVEEVSDDYLDRQYRVRALPLLRDILRF